MQKSNDANESAVQRESLQNLTNSLSWLIYWKQSPTMTGLSLHNKKHDEILVQVINLAQSVKKKKTLYVQNVCVSDS